MTTFIDGPFHGESIELKRSPMALRVVRDPDHKWDALDLPKDEVYPNESIWLYLLQGNARTQNVTYLDSTGKKRSKVVATAVYRYVEVQPADGQMRTNRAWMRWMVENRLELAAAWERTVAR